MKACFMGLGYIGLPTAIIAAKHGIQVIGVDINPEVVDKTNNGCLHFIEPGLEDMLKEVVRDGVFHAALKPEHSDAFFIVVPTPFCGNHEPDISYVEAATRTVIPFLEEGNLFVIESTSPVGTTDKIYRIFVQGELHPTNCKTAELCKLTENSSRDSQIAFANELSIICDKADINVWELIKLANKHPRVNILQPGCGVGGHCIAIDPYFIATEFPAESKMISTAREVNNYKSFWCAEKTINAILEFEISHKRKPVVAMMGLAFKPDIDDLRESPAKYIVTKVIQKFNNADILIVEPNLKEHKIFKLSDYREAYCRADIVVFLTAHSVFKTLSWRDDKVILDFCGIFRKK